ncbi:MAG: esterase/lipase family protein [Actinomycetota bacterium]
MPACTPRRPGPTARRWAGRLAVPCLLAVVLGLVAPATGRTDDGPPLSVEPVLLAQSLHCYGDVASATRDPVILLHGTTSTGRESWRSGYVPALREAGYPACIVDFPDRSMGDIQVSAEYAVAAVRTVSAQSGRNVALVGHSQGALEALWAVRFWPDVRERVTNVVAIGTPFNGTVLADLACAMPGGCQPSVWQMTPGSAFLRALHAAPLPEGPAYTSIATIADEITAPQPAASRLEGARNILIQDVCAGRPIDHLSLLYDSVTFAMVADALANPGPADPARLPPAACGSLMITTDTRTFLTDAATGLVHMPLGFVLSPRVGAEPAVAPYAAHQ